MLERYRTYILAHPLQGWLIAVTAGVVISYVFTWVIPDSGNHSPSEFLLLVCVAFSSPTAILMMRLSEHGRREKPITPEQEQGIATLSLIAGVCAIGALTAGIVSRWIGWPLGVRVGWLTASMLAAAIAAALGYGLRSSRGGRWAVRLSAGWGMLLVFDIVGSLLWRAAGHA